MSAILEFKDLQNATGYKRMSDVEKCLRLQNIRVFSGRDGVWTTIDLVNAAGGLAHAPAANSDKLSPDDLL